MDKAETLNTLGETSSGSSSQIKAVQERLKRRLVGENVRIPVTSKAFFHGVLEPSLTVDGEEKVIVNIGESFHVEVQRNEAYKVIERRLSTVKEELRTSSDEKGNTSKQGTRNKKKGNLEMKKGFLNNSNTKKSAPKIKSGNRTKKSTLSGEKFEEISALPFLEIREEFDKDGNEVGSGVLNMSNELTSLQQKLQGLKREVGKSDEKEKIVGTLLEHLPADLKDDHESMDSSEEGKKQRRSQEEISARLDQLILLEEEEEQRKILNRKSSNRLRGKGWAKGFLEKETKEFKFKQPSNSNTARRARELNKDEATIPKANDRQSKKKVQFSSTNDVKQIPRIGTKKFPQTRDSPSSVSNRANDVAEHEQVTPKPRQPVSLGAIKERNASTDANGGKAADTMIGNDETPKKRVSRFAQRRQEERFNN